MVCVSGGAEDSVLVSRAQGGGQLVGLVLHSHGDGTDLVAVFARVVSAEEELAAALELDPKVGLSSATVASVLRRQCGSRGKCSGHIGLISLHLYSVNVPSGANIPEPFSVP